VSRASVIALVGGVLLAGCASTKDIDLSKVEPQCGARCTDNYQQCTNRPGYLFFPIEVQRQCVSSLRLCAQACPARGPVSAKALD
jgi:hypothetical protein